MIQDSQEIVVQLFLSAAREFLSIVDEMYPGGQLPIENRIIDLIEGDQIEQINEEFISRFFYHREVDLHKRFEGLAEAKSYLTHMLENEVVEFPDFSDNDGKKIELSVQERVDKGYFDWEQLVVYPVVDVILSKKNVAISDDELIEAYNRYIDPRTSAMIAEIKNTPLIGFESSITEFKFSEEFSIQMFSDYHKNDYNKLTRLTNGYSTEEICGATHMIRYECLYPRGNKPEFYHEHYLYLLVMAMRICASADIVIKFSYYEPKKLISIMGGGGKWHFETSKPWRFYDKHSFDKADLERSKELFTELLRLEKVAGYKNIFNVVVSRYLSSLSRASPEDSVIDFTICLESLLLADVRDELKFRLSLRGAVLLQDEDPKITKKSLSDMYNDRSDIVHSGKKLDDIRNSSSGDTLKIYRKLTEKIILAYISKSAEFDSISLINLHLDELCIMAGKKPKYSE